MAICNQMVWRTSFRLICSSVIRKCTVSLPHGVFEVSCEMPKNALDYTRPGVTIASKFLIELANPDEIPWDDLIERLKNLEVPNPSTKIFQACVRLQNVDMGINYYNYMVQKGEQLSMIDKFIFCKLLSFRREDILEYEDMIIKMYDEVKEYIVSSALIRRFILSSIVEIPSIFNDIVKTKRPPEMRSMNQPIILKALEKDMEDVVMDYINDPEFLMCETFVDAYIDFCIRKIEQGKFSVNYINKLVNICQNKAVTLHHSDLLVPFQRLVSTLMKYQNDYFWSVEKCQISDTHICSCCGQKLVANGITEEEFQILKNSFYEMAFSNVYLKTTKYELRDFMSFLEKTKPYNMVMDGLNLLYRGKTSMNYAGIQYIKYFVDQGYQVLTIGREHAKANFLKAPFMSKEKYLENTQFYFTSNMSDDDSFLLQASLHGGLNTYFITGDFLTTHLMQFSPEVRTIFLKWQASHHYLILPNFELDPVRPHCGLPQLTFSRKGNYTWHLSSQNRTATKIKLHNTIKWYCLRARKESLD